MKYLIITGGSKGIGRATVELFQQQQWQVLNLSRSPCSVDGVLHIETDLTDSASVQAALTKVTDQISSAAQICLVHNASLYHNDSAFAVEADALRAMFEVAVVAPTTINQTILPLMAEGSSIIYVGSTLSEKGVANCASYVSVKHAVAGMMKATCQDLPNALVHTCCICPGFTETEMLSEHLPEDETIVSSLKAKVRANRFIKPVEIAKLIAQAAESPVLNGAVIHGHLGQLES